MSTIVVAPFSCGSECGKSVCNLLIVDELAGATKRVLVRCVGYRRQYAGFHVPKFQGSTTNEGENSRSARFNSFISWLWATMHINLSHLHRYAISVCHVYLFRRFPQ